MTNAITKDIMAVLMREGQLSLPSLGTFTLERQAAVVNAIEGKMSPPTKRVTFNPNLKISDGRLLRYLQDTYALEAQIAQQRIDAFEAAIQQELSTGNPLQFSELGRLFRDHTGEIRFTPSQQNLDKAAFGLQDLPLQPIVRSERTVSPAAVTTATDAGFASTIPPVTPVEEHAEDDPLGLIWLFLQQHIWYIAGGTALLFLLGLWYINQRNQPEVLPTTSPLAERDQDQEQDRVNVAPRPEVETYTPTIDATEDTEDETVEDTPPVNVAPAARTKEALIAIGRYGQQRNVNKMVRRIKDTGYEPYTKNESGLTRVGIRYSYSSDGQLDRVLSDVRRRFTRDAFVVDRDN